MRTLKTIEHSSPDGVIRLAGEGGEFPYAHCTAPDRSAEGRAAILTTDGERFALRHGHRTVDAWSGYWLQAPRIPLADRPNAATKYVDPPWQPRRTPSTFAARTPDRPVSS